MLAGPVGLVTALLLVSVALLPAKVKAADADHRPRAQADQGCRVHVYEKRQRQQDFKQQQAQPARRSIAYGINAKGQASLGAVRPAGTDPAHALLPGACRTGLARHTTVRAAHSCPGPAQAGVTMPTEPGEVHGGMMLGGCLFMRMAGTWPPWVTKVRCASMAGLVGALPAGICIHAELRAGALGWRRAGQPDAPDSGALDALLQGSRAS